MNQEIALQWVIDHEITIRKFAGRYIKRTPYGYEDFISSARVAAILASNKVQGNAELFNKAFWTCYQNVLSEFSPNPFTKSKRSNCSMSIPTDLCDYPDEWSYIDDNTGGQDL